MSSQDDTANRARGEDRRHLRSFWIPEAIRRRRLSTLPVSKDLLDACSKLKLRRLGDLDPIDKRELLAATGSVAQVTHLLLEISELVWTLRQDPKPKLALARHHARVDYLYLPVGKRSTPLPRPPATSVRLWNGLANEGVMTLGDLHGFQISDCLRIRNFGKKTAAELVALVCSLDGGLTTAELLQTPVFTPPPAAPDFLLISPRARDLDPDYLPLSLRAEKALKRLGIHRLGDLEGMTRSKLAHAGKCGKKTALELRALLDRANAGEFDVTPEILKKMSPLDLLSQLDERLLQLERRDREIVTLRLGGGGQPPAVLTDIARRFRISSEQVRQILIKTLGSFSRLGGPKRKALFDKLAATCQDRSLLLTPGLLQKWAAPGWPFRYRPEFYVRALSRIRPDIPSSG
jgi:hypothetical protein